MALKKYFTDEEKFGLTKEETIQGEKYLRKHKTAGAVKEPESYKLYEMFMLGCSFYEIHTQYPQYPVAQIILTAALKQWAADREKMMGSLQDMVQAKVVRAVMEQVELLTTMLSVTNAEHLASMKKYIADPENTEAPSLKIESIKDYKEVADTLQKLVAGAQGRNQKASPMFETMNRPLKNPAEKEKVQVQIEDVSAASILASEVVDG